MKSDWDINKQMIQRAEALGFKALVITIDVPVVGNRRWDKRNQLNLDKHIVEGSKNLRSLKEVKKISDSMGIYFKKDLG